MSDIPPLVDEAEIVDRMVDQFNAPEPNWNEWAREASDFEQRFAKALLEAEEGDALVALWMFPGVEMPTGDVLKGEEGYLEIRYRDDRPGVTELRLELEMIVWVVREQYVFITSRSGEHLIMGAWHDAAEGDWVVVQSDDDD